MRCLGPPIIFLLNLSSQQTRTTGVVLSTSFLHTICFFGSTFGRIYKASLTRNCHSRVLSTPLFPNIGCFGDKVWNRVRGHQSKKIQLMNKLEGCSLIHYLHPSPLFSVQSSSPLLGTSGPPCYTHG